MKRQHVLVLLVVVAALAVALVLMKSSPRTEVASTSDEVAVSTAQDEGVVMNESMDADAKTEPAPASDAAAKTADAPAEGANPTSEEVTAEIKENLATARQVLQQKAAIEKAKPEEVHRMPKATLDAAKRLGEIAELEAKHPEQAESFKEFYLECARDENTITVTRAQCVNKYMKAAKLDAAAQKEFLSGYPEEVVRLVEALQ